MVRGWHTCHAPEVYHRIRSLQQVGGSCHTVEVPSCHRGRHRGHPRVRRKTPAPPALLFLACHRLRAPGWQLVDRQLRVPRSPLVYQRPRASEWQLVCRQLTGPGLPLLCQRLRVPESLPAYHRQSVGEERRKGRGGKKMGRGRGGCLQHLDGRCPPRLEVWGSGSKPSRCVDLGAISCV